MESVDIRNLEQIQEGDLSRRGAAQLWTFLLAGIAGAALVVAWVMLLDRDTGSAHKKEDPLAALVADAKKTPQAPEKLENRDVTFPAILSDETAPTTALAAVKDERGELLKQPAASQPDGLAKALVVAPERVPGAARSAGSLLQATPVTTKPKDPLTSLASQVSEVPKEANLAPGGSDSGFQIQVASYREQADADAFVEQLRKRGHRAFRVAASVPDRGEWHRVRVGPFKTKYEAERYKDEFEKTEHIAPFLVDPEQVRRAHDLREAKLRERTKE